LYTDHCVNQIRTLFSGPGLKGMHMTSNRIPHWAALAITTAAAGLSPGGAHAYKAYATAAVAQVNYQPGVVDYGQQLTATSQASATLPNIFEQTATSADLARGQVRVKQEQLATGASTSLQTFGQAWIADSFMHLSGLNPFTWTNATHARFDIHIDGVESLTGNLGQMLNSAKVMLMIYKPGTLDGLPYCGANVIQTFSWSIGANNSPAPCGGTYISNLSGAIDTNFSAVFTPGGDFDWAFGIVVGGQSNTGPLPNATGRWVQDFANTATLSYGGPSGSTVVSGSGVFPGSIAAVPEPGSTALLLVGLACMVGLLRRRAPA